MLSPWKKKGVFIIAEAGVNHNGSVALAEKMIITAHKAGADAIKFQTFKANSLISKDAPKAEYQKENTGSDESQREMVKKLELTYEEFAHLKDYANKVGISFLSTPFEIESIEYLNRLGMEYWKIPSGEITNLPYLYKIAKTGKPIVLSTGMSEINEIEEAIKIFKDQGLKNSDIILLQCTTDYPADPRDVNLKVMNLLKQRFGVNVGLSDHTEGIEISLAAVAMGAKVIEKHFTLDKNMEGPDHKASLEPAELEKMIKGIRKIEMAIRGEKKELSEAEKKNKNVVRKSIVAKTDIKKGEVFTEDNLTTKRPGNGISPMRWNEIIGRVAIRDFEEDELIEL